ncbi:hypothetical protein [uncultured Thermosynechococcus sp.]|uniref:hypothetical protein n=1 Tax=uncultured Thermosynechococcus sp. TaxID=436945 RepID=UPI00262CCC38|nr:hypothetical protein [uncultured Thermosynechococcus sp.]
MPKVLPPAGGEDQPANRPINAIPAAEGQLLIELTASFLHCLASDRPAPQGITAPLDFCKNP